MTSFSIVIPTYNYGNRIGATIDSVLAQKDFGTEIIIVDDGSTDDTANQLQPYLNQFPQVRYFYQENKGPGAARNRGVKEASGDFILPLDADDILLPNALEAFRNAIQEHPEADLIIGTTLNQSLSGKPHQIISNNRKENFLRFIQKKIAIPHGSNCLRRTIFETIQYPEKIRGREDIVFYAQAFANFDAISITTPVCEIIKHDDSFRHTSSSQPKTLAIVEAIFNPQKLPLGFLQYRDLFESGLCLSFFRDQYRQHDYRSARQWYYRAIKKHPFHLFEWRYLSKFLKSLLPS